MPACWSPSLSQTPCSGSPRRACTARCGLTASSPKRLDAIAEIRPGADAAKRFTVMRQAFSEALVTGWEGREVGIILPDPDDRHVVAAAIHGGAHAIVTANVVDFPSAMLRPLGLEAVHPDDFLLDQLDLSPAAIVQVFSEQAADTRRPPLSRQDLVTILGRVESPGSPPRSSVSCPARQENRT